MTQSLVVGILFVAAAAGQSVGIFLDFDVDPSELALKAMMREVENIMRPTGIKMDWRRTRDNRGMETFPNLVVVKFKGACQVGGYDEMANSAGTLRLGATAVSQGRVLPFSQVECDQVRQSLSYLEPGTSRQERQYVLGTAMARVVAHELYHILASTTGHARRGLARATQDMRDLVKGRLRFQERDFRAIRNGFLRGAGLLCFSYPAAAATGR